MLTLALNQVYETPEMPLDFHRTGGPLADGTYAPGLGDAEIDAAIDLTKETAGSRCADTLPSGRRRT